MQIAILQMQPAPADPDRNIEAIERAARAASAFGAAMLVTPEMSITGYAIGADIARLAEPRDGALAARIRGIAEASGLHIVAGFPEREGERVFNAAMLASPSGNTIVYRKCHLYGAAEKAAFAASDDQPAVFDVAGVRVGLLICYDVEFPEMVRALAVAGAELVIVPTALPAGAASLRVSQALVPTRAMENHVFIAYADLCGSERGLAYQGGSVVVGPDGEDLCRAGTGPALLCTRLDRRAYDIVKAENPYLDDRRPGLYASFAGR